MPDGDAVAADLPGSRSRWSAVRILALIVGFAVLAWGAAIVVEYSGDYPRAFRAVFVGFPLVSLGVVMIGMALIVRSSRLPVLLRVLGCIMVALGAVPLSWYIFILFFWDLPPILLPALAIMAVVAVWFVQNRSRFRAGHQ